MELRCIVRIIKFITLIIWFCSFSLVVCCSNKHNQDFNEHKVFVSAITVHSTNVPVIYSYTGVISPANETKIVPQVSGILLNSTAKEGSYVKAGTSLFNIDAKEYEMRFQEALAKKDAAQSMYQQALKASKRAKQLQHQQILSNAMAETVFAKGDEALSNFKQAEINYQQANLNLEYCNIKAPISGTIGEQLMPDGSLVNAGSSILAILTQIDKLYFDFSLSSRDFIDIKHTLSQNDIAKSSLYLKIYANNKKSEFTKANLDFTAPSINQTTGTINAKAVLQNNNMFIPGEFVHAELEGVNEYGVAIPEESLVQDETGTYVYVIKEIKLSPKAPAQLLAVKTNVKILKQLENRNWLLENDNALDSAKILTKGLFMVEGAMAKIKGKLPGVPVILTNLDDSEV